MTANTKPELHPATTQRSPDMYRKYGDLSQYAFACGYVQTVGGEREFTKAVAYLYHDGGCCHVRRPLAEGEEYHLPMGWDAYDSLTVARNALRKYGPFTNHRDGGTLHPKMMH